MAREGKGFGLDWEAMHFTQQTLPTLAVNLAFDEALLVQGEATGQEFLRVWEWPQHAVVLGAGGILADDVNVAECQAEGIEITRRSSGGGTVLLGQGCLLFSLVLSFDRSPDLLDVRRSYPWILERILDNLPLARAELALNGSSDLTYQGRKFSGNAQQRKRTHLLHHGTLLYGMNLEKVSAYLKPPPRQPEYRQHRPHADFIGCIPVHHETVVTCLRRAWQADADIELNLNEPIARSVQERFSNHQWIFRR